MFRTARNLVLAAAIAMGSWANRVQARYEGATRSTSRSHIPAAVQSARFDASCSARNELVRKARYFEKNSAIFNRLADIFENYTAGAGLQLTPASSDPEWNKRAKEWWDGWCRYPDLTSRSSFGTVLSLIARTWFVDGECFVLLTKGESGRPRIQLLEGHLCATPPSLAHLEGNTIVDGIGIDQNGRPIEYWFASEDARGNKIWGKPTPAEYVIHVGEPSRAGMYRPLPFCYPVINKLHDLDDLEILEMKAAKEAARHINFIKNAEGSISPQQLEQARYGTTKTISTGSVIEEERRKYYQEGVGGETIVGKHGDEMERLSSNRPTVVTREYWKDLKADVCAGFGIPYVLVYPESMQGTVYRGALDMADAFFGSRFLTIEDCVRRIYEYVMGVARYRERNLQNYPGNWAAVVVHQPRSVNVDVGRNQTALLQGIAAATSTYDDAYGPLGYDWRERFDRLKEQQDYAEKIGLKISFPGQPAQPAAVDGQKPSTEKPPEPEEDPEDEPAVPAK